MQKSKEEKLVGRASFDAEKNVIVFGGAHFYYAPTDALIEELRIGHLITGHAHTVPEDQLAFAQRYPNGTLVPGGSGLQLNVPEKGFSTAELHTIDKFVTRMDVLLDKLRNEQRGRMQGKAQAIG